MPSLKNHLSVYQKPIGDKVYSKVNLFPMTAKTELDFFLRPRQQGWLIGHYNYEFLYFHD